MWQLIDPESKHAKPTMTDRGLVAFFSILTIGILPLITLSRVRSRRTRRVRYEFEADGARHRGSDWVLPSVADPWEVGDSAEVLYLPDAGYDSVIVSTS